MPRSDYEQRVAARQERLENAAERANANATAYFKKADMSEEATGIPFGQPILVGHHSEARHRKTIDRAWNAMGKAVAETKKAEHYASAAESVGTAGVSSDDPDGVDKLTEKLAKLEAAHAKMIAANKAIRAGDDAALVALVGQGAADRLKVPPYPGGPIGFPSYSLTNNGATIRATKARIEQLKAAATVESKTIETNVGCTVIENADENRVQIVFPGKPDEATRALLKSRGFRWSPTAGAWQRFLNNAGRWAAQCVVKDLTPAA